MIIVLKKVFQGIEWRRTRACWEIDGVSGFFLLWLILHISADRLTLMLNSEFRLCCFDVFVLFIFRTGEVAKWSCSQLWCRFLSLIMQIKGMHCTV